jgi:hypothetical protein
MAAAAWAALMELLSGMGNVLGTVLGIKALLTNPDGPNSLVSIGTEIRALTVYSADPSLGLPAIMTDLTTIDADIVSARSAILAAIAALPAAGDPVTLPTIPPTGYGSGSIPDIVGAVWAFPLGADSQRASIVLSDGAYASVNTRILYDNINATRYFWPVYWSYNSPIDSGITSPTFDPGDVLAGETSLDTLTRQNPTATCDWWDGVGGHVHVAFAGTASVQEWVSYFDDYLFVHLYSAAALPATLMNESLWPGLANVTLGTPVDLAPGVTITEPMNGVIVTLTGVPSKASWYDFDGTLSYRNLGQLAFETDNGNFDLAQSLGFTSAIYVPRSMYLAAGVKMRTVGGVSGTVTPWVIVTT